ncbi:fasciclin domain-containing protein [Chitinophaga horti]|uniref:Fasciclin domain-containing protein n=1 Tax=Chitinophaga horti TaxID=2920382 RepID=A0ABY6J300_9BACT|nr:fasciclin domain-containing protein [Chitinophaga horti]UYQ94043.1 fasciclin domain-containing protein [Chitinophaga horti]
MKNKLSYLVAVSLLLSFAVVQSCQKMEIKIETTGDVNIVGYLEKYPDSFSLFKQVLDRTETSAFLNAYGAYTFFAPTNSAVKTWLTQSGFSSVEAANIETLKSIVQFHLIMDTLTTTSFKDGKLPVPTLYGQYLITGVSNKGGSSSFIVNRQALVIKSNVRVGNGFIHEIDHVLQPSTTTLAKQLEAKPEFSIFVQAIKETGLYERLNTVDADTSKRWMTLLAESNRVLADSGIHSYADLKAKYSNTGNPTNPADSLHIYVAYHILTGVKFLGDIISTSAHQTLQPQEVVSTQLINSEVILNEDMFNGVLEKGVTLIRDVSDNAASNGVWHDAGGHFTAKYRPPTAVYWDVSTFTEIMKMPANYRKANFDFRRQTEADQPLKDIYWGWGPLAGTNTFTYYYNSTNSVGRYAVNNDVNQLPLGLPNRPIWWEMVTPPIVKGKYKIWMCYSRSKQSSSSNQLCQVTVNGELMPRTFNFTELRPKGSDTELEAIGWKQYTETRAYSADSNYAGKLVGTYEFKTTQRQLIRIIPISGTQNNNYLDMIHIIPVDDNQLLPKFATDGSKKYN